jgi:replicative DNA helicase
MKIVFMDEIKPQSAEFVLKNFLPIPRNAVTLLSASGGTGKTRLSLIMADRFIKENDKIAALWLTEDYDGQVRHIIDEMINHSIISHDSIKKMALIIEEPPQLAKRENGIFKANYEEIRNIGEHLIKLGVHFAVFDPLLAFYGGNENDNSEARVFIQSFAEWAKSAKITTLIIHHSNKEGGSRGATAFHDGVRARYELDIIKDDKGEVDKEKLANGLRKATLRKDNWGARKHLWKITDGEDELIIKVAPPLQNEYKKDPEVSNFKNDDNEFLSTMFD